ncbi:hypothetical protein [Ignicoccus hospitalis]|uniref:Uncharacterized protein n=1 Tax=Ignicoccus hospitalis (strain KIN4/I / DSM 18386 / JCM 14125) TaxID=453591 RepID=A8AA80_IGNH4|nr:hypothetical protein [Ignicoccus hospitalis]ABU81832.1 hypothetical protein Igni_0650 [Ignicoccus hospitalis KIN4/I]HIH90101.1 hypothetical protein [Desulfurococcaceae archaeon]
MKKNLAFKLGLCPIVLAMEHVDHEAKRRYAKLYDPINDTLIDLELPYSIYLLSDVKGQHECWEDALKELGVEWSCPHAQECPIKRRQAYQRQEQSG